MVGANNPVWIIRRGELIEETATRQPVGLYEKQVPFQTKTLILEAGDCIYVFSDGFKDQFGQKENKKFKASRLKKILISSYSLPMNQQKELLENVFMDWKGNVQQHMS